MFTTFPGELEKRLDDEEDEPEPQKMDTSEVHVVLRNLEILSAVRCVGGMLRCGDACRAPGYVAFVSRCVGPAVSMRGGGRHDVEGAVQV